MKSTMLKQCTAQFRVSHKRLLAMALPLFGLVTSPLAAAIDTSAYYEFSKKPVSLILVNKQKSQLHVAEYVDQKIELVKTLHVTLGKAQGDKQVEKDLKTPEGFYFFTQKFLPPTIKKKLGAMAIMVNYPNPVDQLQGKTGYDIMLHATDDPSRLVRDRDSEGCLVVNNDEILQLEKSIRAGVTPVLIYDQLDDTVLKNPIDPLAKTAFERWLAAWNEKNIDDYIGSYRPDFSYSGMNLKRYREHKLSLNKKYSEIKVRAANLRFYKHPKYVVATFTQQYQSKLRGGGRGFDSQGTKAVYLVKEGDAYRIAAESYSNLVE